MDTVIELKRRLASLQINIWRENELFSFQWWLLLFLLILPWFIWWRIVDKRRLLQILVVGLIAEFIGSLLDVIGRDIPLWEYPYQLQPLTSHLESIDLSLLPITYMTVYQYFKRWKTFLISMTIVAFIASFIIEPVFVWAGLYKLIQWKHVYSFPIYILVGAVCKYMADKLSLIQSKHYV